MSLFDRRRRAIAGADYRFPWISTDGYPAEDPTLTMAAPIFVSRRDTVALTAVSARDTFRS